jgi:hypothetical protein
VHPPRNLNIFAVVNVAAKDEAVQKLRAELRSLRLDNAETEELVETNRQLDAANKELGAALDAEVRTTVCHEHMNPIARASTAVGALN